MLFLQVVFCRSLIARQAILKFEFSLMRKFMGRGDRSHCCNFSYCISFRATKPSGTDFLHYVRLIENGHFVGLAKYFHPPDAVLDVLVTHDDAQQLSSLGSRKQKNDINSILQLWATVRSFLGSFAEDATDIVFWLVLDDGTDAIINCHNVSEQQLSADACTVSTFQKHDLPSIQMLLASNLNDHASQEAGFFLNCVPNLSLSSSNHDDDYKYFSCQSSALRSQLMHLLHTSSFSLNFVPKLLEHHQCAQRQTLQRQSLKRSSTRKRRTFSTDADRSTVERTSEAAMGSDGDEGFSWTTLPSFGIESLVSRVRSSLMRCGLLRILRNDKRCVQVVWNAYDPKSGALRNLKFATTTVDFFRGQEAQYTCADCPSYHYSTQLQEADIPTGFCAHTQLIAMLIPHLTSASSSLSSDPFVTWCLDRASQKEDVVKVYDSGGLQKFLVRVTDGIARSESTSEVSLCHVWLNSERCRLSCSTAHCTTVTMAKVKQVDDKSTLCCHLRQIFLHDTYQHIWDSGHVASSGFDVASSKTIEDEVFDLEGEQKQAVDAVASVAAAPVAAIFRRKLNAHTSCHLL
jgi:hypothetical protein